MGINSGSAAKSLLDIDITAATGLLAARCKSVLKIHAPQTREHVGPCHWAMNLPLLRRGRFASRAQRLSFAELCDACLFTSQERLEGGKRIWPCYLVRRKVSLNPR